MQTLKKHLKSGQYSPIYLFHGEESFLIDFYLGRMVDGLLEGVDKSMNYDEMADPKTSAEDLENAIDTLPFLADRRLVVLKRLGLFEKGAKDKQEKVLGALENKPEETFVIIVEDKADKRTKLYKHIDKNGHIAQFSYLSESDMIKYIASGLGRYGKRIDAATARYLIHYTGTELSMIHQEIQKLADFTGDEEVISTDDIEQVCTKSMESKIFELVDCMGTNRRARALKLYHDLVSSKEPPLRILFMLSRQFRLTYKAKLCHSHGLGEAATVGRLKVQPFVAKKCLVQARAFTVNQLERALNDCLSVEDDIKSGLIDPEMGIESLIIKYSE